MDPGDEVTGSTRPFWLRPKWVVGHVVCLALVVLFVNLGFWQLRRLDERQARNDRIEQRMAAAPTGLADALRSGADAAEYRRVEVEGTWLPAAGVLVRSRSLDGRPGYHAVTPLRTADGTVLVNRGFVPRSVGEEEPELARRVRPPAARVRVEGILRATETRQGIGPREPEGRLEVVSRIDVARLSQQVDDLVPVYLQLVEADPPPPAAGPRPLPPPETDEGSHLSYAVQWFIFATVGAVGWPLLLRKTAREERVEADQPA